MMLKWIRKCGINTSGGLWKFHIQDESITEKLWRLFKNSSQVVGLAGCARLSVRIC
jgi:hypothetical protein